jgi:hypothetical protein
VDGNADASAFLNRRESATEDVIARTVEQITVLTVVIHGFTTPFADASDDELPCELAQQRRADESSYTQSRNDATGATKSTNISQMSEDSR